MSEILLIHDGSDTSRGLAEVLRTAGYEVTMAPEGKTGLALLEHNDVDVVISGLDLANPSDVDILAHLRAMGRTVPFLVLGGFGGAGDAVIAVKLGPGVPSQGALAGQDLVRAVDTALMYGRRVDPGTRFDAPAAARWARALIAIVDANKDPRTIAGWSRVAYVSSGALRNWCRAAGISPRRSLVFARLLRAIVLSEGTERRPEHFIDVVDRRTLAGLLHFAGLGVADAFPREAGEFLDRQILIRDDAALSEIRRAFGARRLQRALGRAE